MELALRDGGTLYYELHGDRGPWLVCLNGVMATTATWAPIPSGGHAVMIEQPRAFAAAVLGFVALV